jgi:hypothetical protein
MESSSVALAAIGLAVTAVGGLIWVVKYFATKLVEALKEHTQAAVELKNFMVNLNGKFEKAYVEKRKEIEKRK